MREKLIRSDVVECVIGLGPNLFYNSPMEACIVICRMNKAPERRGRILFINAVNEVKAVAAAMGLMLGDDLVDEDLYIADMAAPGSTTSLVRDLEAGRPSEIEGLIRSMVLWGVTHGVPTPAFKRASVAAHERYGV